MFWSLLKLACRCGFTQPSDGAKYCSLCVCVAEVRAATDVAVEEEGFQAVNEVQHTHTTLGLVGCRSILSDEHHSEVVPPQTMTHCLLPSLAPLQSVSLQFLLQHIFICSVPFWLFN